ncbi:protein FAM216B [Ambystoma mexicanum]|uniref:protein FAM216B n=1 Tax=Ambystoma mexicanum TaxID=8296 RepID=UPI0037E99B19
MEGGKVRSNPEKMERVRVPSSARSTALFKDLRPGQKRYLYSIMRVYDPAPGRELIYHRYILSLQHQCILGHLTQEDAAHYISILRQPEKEPPKTRDNRQRRKAPICR